jgi:hypothetical protein
MTTLLLATGLLAGLLFPVGQVASAASDADAQETIAVSPASNTFKLDAGATSNGKLTVVNGGTTAYRFKVYVSPYSVNGVEYKPDFFTKRTNTDIESWVRFTKSTYDLKPGASVEIPYRITVPTDATPGGHYGVIFVETQPGDDSSNSVERKKRVGSLIYATVNGDYQMGGSFGSVRTAGLQFVPPIRSELNVENSGDADFAVETVYAVSDIFGNRKFTDTKEYRLLPKTTRAIQLEWQQSPGFGFYQVTVSAKFLDKQTTHTSYVLMAPIAFYMVFALGLLVGVIYFLQKRRSA